MPLQIYCDYLEDKGIDARLLRTQEVEGGFITNGFHFGAGYGDTVNGDGRGGNYTEHPADGWGCGENTEDGNGGDVFDMDNGDSHGDGYMGDYIGGGRMS